MLEFRHVSFAFAGRRDSVEVLNDISFTCAKAETVAVVGPSGCGKSTLMSLIAGLRAPASGEIAIDGKPVTGPNPALGVLFQHNTLLPWRSVEENVELGLEIRRVGKAERTAKARALIAQFGLGGFERKYPHALSGGMQKRVALMQTLATEPRILLLDEPFAALDAQTRLVIEDEVVKVCRAEGRTMLMVTHDIAEAISMADRIVVLSRRPARVKVVFETPLSRRAGSVAEVPAMAEFAGYFRRIWESLEVSIPGRAEPEAVP